MNAYLYDTEGENNISPDVSAFLGMNAYLHDTGGGTTTNDAKARKGGANKRVHESCTDDTATGSPGSWKVACQPDRTRKYEFELWLEVANILAREYLRARPTLPENATTVRTGARLPPVCCGFKQCSWSLDDALTEESSTCARCTKDGEPVTRPFARELGEHPWDKKLQDHVQASHSNVIVALVKSKVGESAPSHDRVWDVYKEAIAVKEREGFPSVGSSVDRRSFEYTMEVYNDKSIRSLICCVCACVRVDTGGIRSQIE